MLAEILHPLMLMQADVLEKFSCFQLSVLLRFKNVQCLIQINILFLIEVIGIKLVDQEVASQQVL